MDHIRGNLSEDLSLAALATMAGVSRYHFHRIFKAVAGETIASFTRRAKLERAVYLMRGAPHRELTSIALEVGFGTPSDFSRVFKSVYGCAPSKWDRKSRLDGDTRFEEALAATEAPTMHPRIVDRPACRLIYVRVRDPWSEHGLRDGYARLRAWFETHDLIDPSSQLLGASWDSEKATPLDRLHYDLGITVQDRIAPEEGFGVHEFPAVRAVEVHCACLRDTAYAWDYLYETWLPDSTFEPAEMPALKRFRQLPAHFGPSAWNVDCSIALRPVRG